VSGAIVADLLIQLLGVAALALVLPVAIWGWRLASHRPLQRERIRLVFWILAVLLGAACAAALPRSATWPLPVGLGGVIGDWLLRLPAALSGRALSALGPAAIPLAAGAGPLVGFGVAAGFGFGWSADAREAADDEDAADDERERGSISLGWLTHGFLSLKARVARLLTRSPRPRVRRDMSPAVRAEPR